MMRYFSVFVLMVSSALQPVTAQTTQPWHRADAVRRIAYRIQAPLAMKNPAVSLSVPTNETASAAVVLADAPETSLPVFREPGRLTLTVPGALAANTPRDILVYFGGNPASEQLEQCPAFSHDYAEQELGHSWSFTDGTTRAVTEFGNNQKVFGHVSVTNGWLRLHANGEKILYFSFGQMFGPIPGPRDLHIDSSVYKILTIRLRQSCEKGTWRVYLCDATGRYIDFMFDVSGTGSQTFRFDLSETLQNFWDGREFRALRIDPIIKRQGLGATDAEVASVTLMPAPPSVTVGPELSREAVALRDRVARVALRVPSSCTADGTLNASLRLYDASDDRITKSPAVWSVAFDNGTPHIVPSFPDGRRFSMKFPSLTEAGTHAWACGLADDFGAPLRPVCGTIDVKPAALTAYRLTPDHAFVPAENPVVEISVQGLDRFGNALQVSIRSPKWRCSKGANVEANRIRGNPAVVRAACPAAVPGVYRFALDDGDGHTGETCVTRIAYRKNAIHLMPNGYLAAADGAPFFPVGGFYANWPHQVLPDGKTLTRSVELFSLGTVLYKHGFPWPGEIERSANAYLKHCRDNGVNCLRTFLTNMDLVGRVDQTQLKAVLHYLDLAWSYGIRLDLVLMEGHTRGPYCERDVLEQVALPTYTAEELARLPAYRRRFLVEKRLCKNWYQRWTDPDVLACRKDFLRELIPALAAHPAIFCYEFENEMPHPPMAWCREMADFLRTIDPHTLVLGNPHPCLIPWSDILCWRESGCDLYSYHPYTDGCPEADQGAVSLCFAKWASQARVPFFPGEGGFYGHWGAEGKTIEADLLARAVRDQNWLSFCAGANGALYWTITQDAQAKEFGKMAAALKAVGFDFTLQRRKRADVALFHPKDEHVPNDSALTMRLLDLGVDFDAVVAAESGGYSVRVDTASTDPARFSLPSTVAKPAPGWQIATWVSEKRDEAVLYLRNVVGGVKDYGDGKSHRYLRDVRPSEAACTLVDAWGTLRTFDLDDGTTRILTPDQNGRVSLGVTTHDFVIRVCQAPQETHRAFGSFIATEKTKQFVSGYHDAPLSLLFSLCRSGIIFNNRTFLYGDRLVRCNLNWVRDHVQTMKGSRYIEGDMTSFLDLMLENQTPSGFFYELAAPLTDGHSGSFGPPSCCKRTPQNGFGLARIELEADVEYLMVEGVYTAWQATGDDGYLHTNLPRLEKGLRYLTSDPKRWDAHYQLVKRARTIDTWDFLNRASSSTNRAILPDDPMGIMHGDNTGLYQAEVLMAKMYRQIGCEADAARWETSAAGLKERINRYLWNGCFYKHYLRLDNTDYGVDEARQLSLSNAYDINRGTADPDMIRSVLNEYRTMRRTYGGELDDFRNLNPPYPSFKGYKAGAYVNGALAPFVAGQLALGAFEVGEEKYGADILNRIGSKVSREGKIAFLYNWKGEDVGGGPRCWAAAEIMNALVTGLAGIRDNGALFRDVTLSPRWVAADEPRAHVRIEYPASGAAVEYAFTYDRAGKRLTFTLLSRHARAKLRVLLPDGAGRAKTTVCGTVVPVCEERVGKSRYVVIDPLTGAAQVEISYE